MEEPLKEGIKNRFLNYSDHNKNAANKTKEYTNYQIFCSQTTYTCNDKKCKALVKRLMIVDDS